MALGQPLGQSNPQRGTDKYLRPEVKADRDVINHIWKSINDLHDRAISGQVDVSNLDDFADCLRQDYGVCAEIVGKGNNFRFSQVGSSKISTGAHLSRHLEKMTGEADNAMPSITGQYICEQFGLASARRSSVERQDSSSQLSSANRVARARRSFEHGASLPTLGDTDGFDDLSEDLSGDDDGSTDGESFVEDDLFLSDDAVDGEPQQAAPSQLLSLDVDSEEESSEGKPFGETSKTPRPQTSQQTPVASVEPPPSRLNPSEQLPSGGAQSPRLARNERGVRRERDPVEATVADAASTFSGLANGSTDGVTVVADAAEVIAVAAAATMLGMDAVRQIQQNRDQRHWERLVALGQNIQATEERSEQIAERIVKAEEEVAANRNGQAQDRASPQPRQPAQSPSEAASRLETQVNDMDGRVAAMGQTDPTSKRLRAPKFEAHASIGKRLDALEAYLSNINQKLDSIEERLEMLEKEVGMASPTKEVTAEGNPAGSRRNGRASSTPKQDASLGRFVGNIIGQRKPRVPSQSQA